MKTNLFDFRRVGLLFQRYFIERFRSELIYWGIMALVFMFFRNNVPAMSALIVVAGAFYASRFFREIHHSSNGIAYFMIPATQLEKLTVAIVMTSLYYFAMMMIAYVTGNLLGTFLNNMLASIDFFPSALFHYSPLDWKLFEAVDSKFSMKTLGMDTSHIITSLFMSFLFIQFLFLLGGIYFKKNQAFKTFSSVIVIQILLAFLVFVEVKLIWGVNHIPDTAINVDFTSAPCVGTILYILLTLFFWVVSYFRLTEKQV
jgi:hypothetical protein